MVSLFGEDITSMTLNQSCGSGSAWIRIHFDLLDPDPQSALGMPIRIRIQEGKNDPQIKKFQFLGSAGCSLLRDEDFSCSLDAFQGDLGISKLQVLLY